MRKIADERQLKYLHRHCGKSCSENMRFWFQVTVPLVGRQWARAMNSTSKFKLLLPCRSYKQESSLLLQQLNFATFIVIGMFYVHGKA